MLNLIHHSQLKNLVVEFLGKSAIGQLPKREPPASLAGLIDQTLLKPEATLSEIEQLCQESVENKFKAVCVQPFYLPTAVRFLQGSTALPITVIGFPLGAHFADTKVFEAQKAIDEGAKELDMVINISALKSQKYDFVFEDIRRVVEVAGEIPVKVIVETAYLSPDEKVFCCACVLLSGAKFIKTSTGFAPQGAQIEDIRLFKHLLGDRVQIKASGGIKTKDQLIAFYQAGADRVGTNSGVEILKNQTSTKTY